MGAQVETLLKWVAGHGLPLAVGLALGACALYVARQVADRFIENRISLAFRDRELRLESRSAFEDRVLEERFKVFNDLVTRLVRITTDLNRLRGGKDPVQEPFLRDGELVPLTQVFEDCELYRLILGERSYQVMQEAALVVLQLARADSADPYGALGDSWTAALKEIREVGEDNFGLSRITWRDRPS